MTTEPAPATGARAADEPSGRGARARIRLTAIFGFLSCVTFVVAWFLPWVDVPPEERPRIRQAAEQSLEGWRKTDPETAGMVKVFLEDVVDEGRLTGLGLFHFLRTGRAVNRHYAGEEPRGGESARPFVVRRAFVVGEVLLAALPLVSLVLAVYFLTHRFRRVKSPVLILMALVGCGAAALSITWLRFAEILGIEVLTGVGLKLAAGAAVVQALGGIFGVDARNWWRVYAGLLATLSAVVVLVWAYVWATP